MLPWSSIFSEEVSSTIYAVQSWISNVFVCLRHTQFVKSRTDTAHDICWVQHSVHWLIFEQQFLLFLITIGPWLIFLAYDILLYLFRTVTYEIPYIGGRARGKERPRAPSLRERPSGDPRVIGIGVPGATYVEGEDVSNERRHDEEENWSEDPKRIRVSRAGRLRVGDHNHNEHGSDAHGANEKTGGIEANARRRAGFKDNDAPS